MRTYFLGYIAEHLVQVAGSWHVKGSTGNFTCYGLSLKKKKSYSDALEVSNGLWILMFIETNKKIQENGFSIKYKEKCLATCK